MSAYVGGKNTAAAGDTEILTPAGISSIFSLDKDYPVLYDLCLL